MRIFYTPTFLKKWKKLPLRIQKLAEEKEVIFRGNPFDSQLKTHKLHGEFKKFYSFSINYKYRIIFEISKKEKETFYFHFVDNHNIYNK
ncbi:MAG: type II toxin-antitoxin system mRNA interferase toxin, RelE/StbE family [Candidatus Pacebacteria bacterium]|nr:type II toxin-antitoxin system mRNA interferase toxin, RelE/StbE family [Candidatus Paceibacterota bacterium]